MKVIVVGSNGMAGHVIVKYLRSKDYSVMTAARYNADYCLDIENITSLTSFIKNIPNDVDFIINCIGLLVKDSIDRPDRAAIVNSWFPHYLENIFKNSRTKIIHLSTDCVFDGKKGNYIEEDIHTEMNAYGRSKSLGELNNKKDITFRMSIIGPEIKNSGTGLMNWILNNSSIELPGWENAWWNGLTTLELAKCLDIYMKNPIITGIYHLVSNDNKINKFDLLCKINSIFDLKKQIVKSQGPKEINKILIDTKQTIDFKISNYNQMLLELKEFYNV